MKKRTTKRALLMSFISLLLCASMLIGTTFAWFTDSVTSANNKIQSGTLTLDLLLLDDETGVWNSIKESKEALFDYDKWEPGYTDVTVLKIANTGSLALKWYAKFVSAEALSTLANVIDVYVKEDVTAYPADRADLSDWTKVGTVAEFVNTIETTTRGTLDAGVAETLGIALKMQETAGNEYQDLTLGAFDIQILATQNTVEEDSFDANYDLNATYPIVANGNHTAGNETELVANAVSVTVPATAPEGVYTVNVTNETETTDANGQTTYTADIDLLKDGVKVQADGVTAYLVQINIGVEKSIAKVLHNGEEITVYSYNSDTGILEFTTDSFSPFTVIYEESKVVKVETSEDLLTALGTVTEPVVIDATGITLTPTGSLATTVTIPAGVTLKGAAFTSGSQCYLVVDGVGEDVVFEECTFDGPGFGMFVIAGNLQDGANMVFESCVFKGQIAPNFVQNTAGTATFNNCKFTVGSDNIGLVNCMGGTHTFNGCTFDYKGGSTFGSNQYVKWNAVNSYSENYSTSVVLSGCTFVNCGTQRFGGNSTLTIK